MRKHGGYGTSRNRRSGKRHHQKPPRRGHDRTYPWRPWQLDSTPDDAVWAARAAVQNSDLLTERFKVKGA